jgi:hypothetical protein
MLDMPASSPQGMHRQSPSGYSQNEFTPGQGDPFARAVNETGQLGALLPQPAAGGDTDHSKCTLSELPQSAVVVQTWCESVPYSHWSGGSHEPVASDADAGHWGFRSVTVEGAPALAPLLAPEILLPLLLPEVPLLPFSRPPQPSAHTKAIVDVMSAERGLRPEAKRLVVKMRLRITVLRTLPRFRGTAIADPRRPRTGPTFDSRTPRSPRMCRTTCMGVVRGRTHLRCLRGTPAS